VPSTICAFLMRISKWFDISYSYSLYFALLEEYKDVICIDFQLSLG